MWSSGYEAALVDFASLPESAIALHRCACRLKGYREVAIEPHRHLDGLIVLREMEAAEELEKV